MSAPANPFDAIVARLQDEGASLGSSLTVAAQDAPGSWIEKLRVESLSGVPAGQIADPGAIEAAQRSRFFAREEIARSPFLQEFLRSPPRANAYLFVQPELLKLREAVHTPPPLREERDYRSALGKTNVRGGELVVGYLRGTLSPEEQAEYERLRKDSPLDPDLGRALGLERGLLDEFASALDFTGLPEFRGVDSGAARGLPRRAVGAAAEQLPLLLKQTPMAAGYALAGGAVTSLVATAGAAAVAGPAAVAVTVPAFKAGATVGGLYGGFKGSFETELFGSLTEFEQVAKKGTSREAIVGAALLAAGVKATLDTASFAVLISKIPGLKSMFASGEILSADKILTAIGKDAASATLVQRFGASYLAAIASETVTEPLQEVVDVAAAAALSGKPIGAEILDQRDRIGKAAGEAFLATSILGAAGPGLSLVRERAMAAKTKADLVRRSEAMHEHVAQIIERAAEMEKLRKGSEETYRELVQGVMAEANQPDVFMSPATFLDLWGKAGKGAKDIPGGIREQIGDALATGRDLVIPTGDYLAYVQPVVGDSAQGHVRLGPDLLDVDEVEVLSAEVEADLKAVAEIDDVLEGATPITDAALFNSAEDAGMTRREFETYTRLRDEAAARPTARIEDAKVRELARRRGLVTKVLRARDRVDVEANAEIRKAVEAEFAANPVWRAEAYLRNGPVKLSRAVLVQMFGNTPYGRAVEKLPTGARSIVSADDSKPILAGGGAHPDVVAEQVGFATGAQMVRALLDAGVADAASRQRAIDAEVTKRINAAEGRPPSETELVLLRSTLEDDIKIDRLILEERALSKKSGQRSTARKVLERAADRITQETAPAKMRPEVYRAAAERSRRKALAAMKAGDYAQAAAYVRREALNRMLAINAVEARHEVAAKLRDLNRWRRSPSVRETLAKAGGEWLAQWEGVFERVSLKRLTQAQRDSLSAFAAKTATTGDSFILPDWLLEGRKAFQDLTLDQVRGLHATVASIQNAARRSRETQMKGQRVALDAAVAESAAEVLSLPVRTPPSRRLGKPSPGDVRAQLRRALDATTTRKEGLIASMAGALSTESALYRHVVRPLHEAQSRYDTYVDRYGRAISEIYDAMPAPERAAMHEVLPETRLEWNGQPLEITRWDVVSLILNLGSESNRTKLLEGYGWDEATVRDVIAQHATESDVKLAIRLQALVESLWPDVAALEERLNGVAPEKIEATPFTVNGITVPGGYWPIFYDRTRSDVGQRAALADIFEGRPQGFSYVATKHKFTISRTEVTAPLLIRFDQILTRHLDEVLLDLAYRETLLDVSRLLRDERMNAAFKETLGPEFDYANFWRPWLQKIAGDTVNHGPLSQEERFARSLRFHAGVFRLGLRATTLMVQPSSLSNAVNVLAQNTDTGRAEIARMLAEEVHLTVGRFAGEEATKLREAVHALSPFMRYRVLTSNPDYRDMVRRLADENSWSLDVAEMAMGWIAQTQYHTADLPTWLVAHRIAQERRGLSGDDAVAFADAMVRLAHGAGSKIDLPATLTPTSEWNRLFKMFYSYPNTVLSQIRETYRRTQSTPETLAAYWWSLALPAAWGAAVGVLGALADGEEPEDALATAGRRFASDHFGLLWFGRWVGDLLTGSAAPRDADMTGIIMRELADLANVSSPQDLAFDLLRATALVRGLPGEAPLRTAEKLLTDEEERSSRSR